MATLVGSFYGEAQFSIDEYAAIRLVEDQMLLSWTASVCEDADYYTVKFSPFTDTDYIDAETVHRTTSFLNFQTEETECVVQQRTGKYMVRCTDTSGNEGEIAEYIFQNLLPPLDGEPPDTDPNDPEWQLVTTYYGDPEWDGGKFFLYQKGDTLRISSDTEPQDGKQYGYWYPRDTVTANGAELRFQVDSAIANNPSTEVVWQFSFDAQNYTDIKYPEGQSSYYWGGGQDVIRFRVKVIASNPQVESGADFARLSVYKRREV